MTREHSTRRRSGSAAGWIVLILILAVLAALVGWRIVEQNRRAGPGTVTPTTMPD